MQPWCDIKSHISRLPVNNPVSCMSHLPHQRIAQPVIVMNNSSKNLSGHILPSSATMAGVCVTVISIIKGMHIGYSGLIVDKVLALDSIIFLGSAACSYFSIRLQRLSLRLESLADGLFMFGLLLMVVGTVGFAFEIL